MSRDYLKGRRCMVWSFMQNARMYEALRDYGDRLDTVGIFTFEVDATGTLSETGTSISSMMTYINKWPHIHWMLTVMNHGTASIFTALRNNTNGAKDKFLTELVRIMEKYPWCAGVDIDLERGGGYENREAANSLFRDIYQTVKAYDPSKLVNICLPGMTGVQGSVGGENWCVYADLNPYCDTASIMSYGMAWAGSAPGPVSPRSWLEGIYNYAVTAMAPKKIFMGLPGYGWNWQIYDTPENLGETYRGISNTYYATSFSKTPDAQLHSDPSVYTIEMRKRGNRVRVYSGSSYTLRFTATVSATSGYAGIQADNEIVCDLLRAGDAWAYEPYECFDVVYPDGVRTSFGRIARSGVTWDEEFQIFSMNSDVDEGSTRSEDISLDYDFFHSHLLKISCGNDYTAKVIPRDINVWTARLFLGDADGFSILYYQDVDSLVYWANEAAYRWGLRGIAIWSLGQEDMRLWEVMPKQI